MQFKQAILNGIAPVADEKCKENTIDIFNDMDGDGGDGSDDEGKEGAEREDAPPPPEDHPEDKAFSEKKPLVVFPWEFPEVVPQECLNLWRPTGTVIFGGGSGMWSLASCRAGIQSTCFALNQAHKDFIHERCVSQIVYEIISGKEGAFKVKRFLNRARSLGGHSVASGTSAASDRGTDDGASMAAADTQDGAPDDDDPDKDPEDDEEMY